MKYIDAEKLKAEIIERLHCNGSFDECGDTVWDYDQGMIAAYHYVLSFIDSLQQEQPDMDLEKALNGLDNAYFDLDGIAVKGATYYLTVNDLKDIARDFYELGLNARKEE